MADPYDPRDPRSLAGPYGMLFRAQDDEEERKRLAALAQANGPRGNALEALAGGGGAMGTLAGSPFSKAPIDTPVDLGGPFRRTEPLPPRSTFDAQMNARSALAGVPGVLGTGMAVPSAPESSPLVGPNDHSPSDPSMGATVPRGGRSADDVAGLFRNAMNDAYERSRKEVMVPRHYGPSRTFLNPEGLGPSWTEWDKRVVDDVAGAAQAAQAAVSPYLTEMHGQTQLDVARENNAARIREAELKYSQKALAGQSLMTLMGSLAGSEGLNPATLQRAKGIVDEMFPGAFGRSSAAPGVAAAPASGGPRLNDLIDVETFLSQQGPHLPKTFRFGGGSDSHGKPIAGMTGALETMTPEAAGNLLQSLAGAKMSPENKKEAIRRLTQGVAGGEIRDKMLQQAAVDTILGQDLGAAPRLPVTGLGGLAGDIREAITGRPSGDLPSDYTVAGTPFSFQRAPAGRFGRTVSKIQSAVSAHDNPYGQVTLPNGQVLPISPSSGYSSYGPFGKSQNQMDEARKTRAAIHPLLYEALGLSLR